jgi:hypothetical protein
MAKEPIKKPLMQFNLDPNNTPILFSDAYVITSSSQTLTYNFAQSLLDGQDQTIVARIAMTLDQAKAFLKNLNDHIEKYER